MVLHTRGKLALSRCLGQELSGCGEIRFKFQPDPLAFLFAQEFGRDFLMAELQLFDHTVGGGAVSLGCHFARSQQLIGHFRQCAHHHHRMPLQTGRHQLPHPPDGQSILYRGATEFHDQRPKVRLP